MVMTKNGKPLLCCYCNSDDCERLGGKIKCSNQYLIGNKHEDMNYHSTFCPKCKAQFEGLRHCDVEVCPHCGFKYDISRASTDMLMNLGTKQSFEEYVKTIEVK